MIAKQKQPAPIDLHLKRKIEAGSTVWAVIGQIAELHHETIRLQGGGECADIAMHVTDHPQSNATRDGMRHLFGMGSGGERGVHRVSATPFNTPMWINPRTA